MLWCVELAVCCSVLQCVAVCCSVLQCVAVCSSVMQCVAVCCSVMQCVAVCCSELQCDAVWCRVVQCVVRCNAVRCIAIRCSVLPCVVKSILFGSSTALIYITQKVSVETFSNASFLQNFSYESSVELTVENFHRFWWRRPLCCLLKNLKKTRSCKETFLDFARSWLWRCFSKLCFAAPCKTQEISQISGIFQSQYCNN